MYTGMGSSSFAGYDLWALQWEWEYIGPRDKNESNLCLCNTVAYSTLCACGACQDHNWISYDSSSLYRVSFIYLPLAGRNGWSTAPPLCLLRREFPVVAKSLKV